MHHLTAASEENFINLKLCIYHLHLALERLHMAVWKVSPCNWNRQKTGKDRDCRGCIPVNQNKASEIFVMTFEKNTNIQDYMRRKKKKEKKKKRERERERENANALWRQPNPKDIQEDGSSANDSGKE